MASPIYASSPFTKVTLRPSGQDGDSVRAGHGHAEAFKPAGLPVPTWCAVINPGIDDPDEPFRERDLSIFFEGANNDAFLALVTDADLESTCQDLWKVAKKDAQDHLDCDNGGAYAIWNLGGGRLILGGFDIGGSDMAEQAVRALAKDIGEVEAELTAAHFNPDSWMENYGEDESEAVVQMMQELLAYPPAHTLGYKIS